MMTTSQRTIITAAAETPTAERAPDAATAVIPVSGAPTNTAAIADLDPTDPAPSRANVAGLAVLRLVKAAIGAAIAAGLELASVEQDLGSEFSTFIETTMLTVVEARTLIQFAGQAGLQPDQLTPAIAVPMDRVLRAMVLLGGTFLEERGQGGDHPYGK